MTFPELPVNNHCQRFWGKNALSHSLSLSLLLHVDPSVPYHSWHHSESFLLLPSKDLISQPSAPSAEPQSLPDPLPHPLLTPHFSAAVVCCIPWWLQWFVHRGCFCVFSLLVETRSHCVAGLAMVAVVCAVSCVKYRASRVCFVFSFSVCCWLMSTEMIQAKCLVCHHWRV